METSPVRWFLPLLIIATTGAGCVYVPLPRTPVMKDAVDPPTLIGDADSKKPIQPNLATKQQVIRLIGEPDRVSPDGRVLGYTRQYKGGAWVAPLCFYGWRQRIDDAYRLEFDAYDVLIRHRSLDAVAPDAFLASGYAPAPAVVAFLDQIGPAAPPAGGPLPQPLAPDPPAIASPYRNSLPDGQWYETR